MTAPESGTENRRLRQAARVALFDDVDRVLLVRFEWPGGSIWALPGGGIERDESPREAACREIVEETGLPHGSLVGPIWLRTAIFDRVPGFDGQFEYYFTARVTSTELSPTMTTDELRDEFLGGAAWWSIPDIIASSEAFAPKALGSLLGQLVADGSPESPFRIGN